MDSLSVSEDIVACPFIGPPIRLSLVAIAARPTNERAAQDATRLKRYLNKSSPVPADGSVTSVTGAKGEIAAKDQRGLVELILACLAKEAIFFVAWISVLRRPGL